MAVTSEVIAVDDDPAVALNDASSLPIHIALFTSDQIFLGGPDVDATVFPWDETDGVLNLTLLPGDVLYAICPSAGNATVSVIRS